MKKIIYLLVLMIGFWSINAQNQLARMGWKNHPLQAVQSKRAQNNLLRNINSTIVLSENFDNATLPAGWTVTDNTGNGGWTFVNDYNNSTLDDAPLAIIDSDGYGTVDTDTELISPEVDVSSLNNVYLSFDHFFKAYLGDSLTEVGDVDVYDGTQWVNVYSVDADTGDWGTPDHQLIDVTAYKNAHFKVRFHYYNANDDWYWAIDNVEIVKLYSNDLAVSDINPQNIIPDVPFNLKATIFNSGTNTQNDFDVTFNIKDTSNNTVFSETVNVTGMLSSNNSTVVSSSSQITLPAGSYTFEATVAINGDEDSSNDTLQITTVDLTNTYDADKLYSNIVYDGDSSGDRYNLINLDVNTGTPTIIGPTGVPSFIASGTFIKGILVGIHFDNGNLYLIDGNTGSAYYYGTFSGNLGPGDSIGAIAYDDNTQTCYISDGSNLYTLDLETLHVSLIGSFNINYLFVGLAIDNNGNMYGISFDDNFYSIDPASGAVTLIGPTGLDIIYVQDIGFDPVSGNLYGTLYNGINFTGGLYIIDTSTGAATAIGTPGQDEYTICAIKGTTVSISGNQIAGLKVYPNPTNGMLLIDAKDNMQHISVINLAGQEVKNFDNNGLKAQLDISDLPPGSYILKISTNSKTANYQILKR